MTYAAALVALALLPVPGVPHRYGVAALPTVLTRAQLPCLLVMPLDVQQDRLRRDAGTAFTVGAFSNGTRLVTHTATHLLLTGAQDSARGIHLFLPALIGLIDAYVAALASDPLLSDTLREPTRVRVEPGVFPWQGAQFYGCAFRHEWLLTVP